MIGRDYSWVHKKPKAKFAVKIGVPSCSTRKRLMRRETKLLDRNRTRTHSPNIRTFKDKSVRHYEFTTIIIIDNNCDKSLWSL